MEDPVGEIEDSNQSLEDHISEDQGSTKDHWEMKDRGQGIRNLFQKETVRVDLIGPDSGIRFLNRTVETVKEDLIGPHSEIRFMIKRV